MICMLISLVLIVAYIVYAISVMQGIPWSVSDTYYQLDKRGRPKWLFQAAMIVPAFLLLPAWLDVSPVEIQFLAFLSGTGLIFVGAAPCCKLELEGKVHYIATGVCGVASLVWICLTGYWLFPLLLFASCIYLTYRYQRPMFWVECSLFLSVYLTVFCLLL